MPQQNHEETKGRRGGAQGGDKDMNVERKGAGEGRRGKKVGLLLDTNNFCQTRTSRMSVTPSLEQPRRDTDEPGMEKKPTNLSECEWNCAGNGHRGDTAESRHSRRTATRPLKQSSNGHSRLKQQPVERTLQPQVITSRLKGHANSPSSTTRDCCEAGHPSHGVLTVLTGRNFHKQSPQRHVHAES